MKYFSLFSGVGGFELAINNVYERKTNSPENNYGKIDLCDANTAKKSQTSTSIITPSAKNVSENIRLSGDLIISKKVERQEKGLMNSGDSKSSTTMEEGVLVAENQKSNSSPSNTDEVMDTLIEKDTELDITISLPLEKKTKINTKSSVTTATTQGEDMDNAPICVGFSEIDKYAISVYKYHYQNHFNYGDITQIDWTTVPDFDLVVGGSPCQDLSVAGKQKGLSGARSGLFFEFVRCLKEKQPTNFIWENVKGALSSSSGWDFARVQIEFSEAGYDTEWQVLNAKDFGVPQNRERVFVVGHLRGRSEPKVFPISTDNGQTPKELTTQASQADRYYSPDGVSPTIPTSGGGRHTPQIEVAIPVITPDRLEKRQNGRRFKTNGEPAFTLNGQDRHGIYDGIKIRRLTPTECERLMSWPDGWTKEPNLSDTQRYKMCGNGVVSKVVEAIIESL